MNREEAQAALSLAIGRLFRLASRPYQPGDDDQYTAARNTALDAAEALGLQTRPEYRPNTARDLP